jgi:hypothetical protein
MSKYIYIIIYDGISYNILKTTILLGFREKVEVDKILHGVKL